MVRGEAGVTTHSVGQADAQQCPSGGSGVEVRKKGRTVERSVQTLSCMSGCVNPQRESRDEAVAAILLRAKREH
jgi:hypothetical protein